ncbi:MAG: exostosin family protein [Armatimonadota bacterium]
MKLHLVAPDTSAGPPPPNATGPYRAFAEAAAESRAGHGLTDDPADAELIVVCTSNTTHGVHMTRFLDSSMYRRWRERCVALSVADRVIPVLPGGYTSTVDERHIAGWSFPVHYIDANLHQFDFGGRDWPERDIPFAFVGATATDLVRQRMMDAVLPEGSVRIDVWPKGGRPWWTGTTEEIADRRNTFKDTMERTRYALCPRGRSANSIRLYEAMEAGCVPVLLADQAVLPEGPDWDSFVVRVREAEVDRVARIASRYDFEADVRGRRARRAWEEWFAPGRYFDRIVEGLAAVARPESPRFRDAMRTTWHLRARAHAAIRAVRGRPA